MLTKEELRKIKMPLSDDDYMLLAHHYPIGCKACIIAKFV
jgi:hypothetical protein